MGGNPERFGQRFVNVSANVSNASRVQRDERAHSVFRKGEPPAPKSALAVQTSYRCCSDNR